MANAQISIQPTVPAFLGYACSLLFERLLFPLGVKGATTVGRLLLGKRAVQIRFPTNARFCFPAADSYYGHYLYHGIPYEPEIAFTIQHSRFESLIDCGANFGYWSCYATAYFKKIVAVELSKDNFRWLLKNADLNDARFAAMHSAVWSADDRSIALTENVRSHAGQSAIQAEGSIRSITVDKIIVERGMDPATTLIKVDCEGAELEVLKGAMMAANSGAMFIFEEHGKDADCAVARGLIAHGFKLYWWADGWEPADIRKIRSAKSNRFKGYNILAHLPGFTLPPCLSGARAS